MKFNLWIFLWIVSSLPLIAATIRYLLVGYQDSAAAFTLFLWAGLGLAKWLQIMMD